MESREPNSRPMPRRMVDLLASYLLASPAFRCPGADGATVEDVVAAEYPAASVAGRVPRPGELTVRHPELAEAITAFFGVGATLAG